jgi:DNA-binding NtrC family response regulator
VRVRILSATNADLRAAIREGRFREDLFYRLNVIELRIPALGTRPDDVLPLARHFLEPGFSLDESAEKALRAYPWPGNARELRNTIRRACLLAADKVIRAANLGLAPVEADERGGVDREPQRQEIEQALERSSGIVAHAARDLGLSRQALYRRMEKLGIRDKSG